MPAAAAYIEIRYRRTDTPGAWKFVKIPPGQGFIDLSDVERGVSYQIEARSVSLSGAASDWVAQTHVVANASLLPIAPTGLTAASMADGVHLAWVCPGNYRVKSSGGSTLPKYFLDFGVSLAVAYNLQISITNNGTVAARVTANTFATQDIAPGQSVTVVFNFNGDAVHNLQITLGVTSAADSMDVTVSAPYLAKVSDGLNLIATANQSFSGWTVGTGATVAVTNDATLQRADVEYEVQRTGDIAGAPDVNGWINLVNVKGTAYTDAVTDGVVRWYRVRAHDYQGNTTVFTANVNSKGKVVEDGATQGDNLCKNGNFDSTTMNWVAGVDGGITGASFLTSLTGLPRGSSEFKVPAGTTNINLASKELIAIDKNKTYLLEAWLKIGAPLTGSLACWGGLAEYDGNKAFVKHDAGAGATQTQPLVLNLSSLYNAIGIYTDGTVYPSTGGYNGSGVIGGGGGSGDSISSNQLGASLLFNGVNFVFGAANANNVVVARGQNIAITPGVYASLRVLSIQWGGSKTAEVFTVNYSDGTHTNFTQGMSDRSSNQSFANESIAKTMSYYNTPAGGHFSTFTNIYHYQFALDTTKSVSSVTMTFDNGVIILAAALMPPDRFANALFANILGTTGNAFQYFAAEIGGNGGASPTSTQFNQSAEYVTLNFLLNWGSSGVSQQNELLGVRFSEVAAGHKRAVAALTSRGTVDLSTSSVDKKGSAAPSYNNAFSYTSTSSSLSWSWNLFGTRTDGSNSNFTHVGSQVISSLSASSTYGHYPFFDENLLLVSMVATGGVGSPSWAHVGVNQAWTAEQARQDHIPLSLTPMNASTAAVGGSGGGSVGGGGACPHQSMKVRHKQWGVIEAGQLEERWDELQEHHLSWRGTWVRVANRPKRRKCSVWIRVAFDCGESFKGTPNHTWRTMEDELKRSNELTVETCVPWSQGGTYPDSISIERGEDDAIAIQLDSKDQMYDIGETQPVLETHNLAPAMC